MLLVPLPRDTIATRLDEIDLLRAMYPSANELTIDDSTKNTLSELRLWCEQTSQTDLAIPDNLSFLLNLEIDHQEDPPQPPRQVSLNIICPLTTTPTASQGGGENHLQIRLRQPSWLTKVETADLSASIPQGTDILSAIEHIQDFAISYQPPSSKTTNHPLSTDPLIRVWFYFPSISTKQKRQDIVNHAPSYSLTGFLLAGKPGLLCLEGTARDIDEYMRFIKTESWSDIPSQHKKVSERYREESVELTRAFRGMEEITDKLEKRGERSNRGDMKALEVWLDEKGLGGAFEKVLF